MTWVAYTTLFFAGLGVGLSVGVTLMASLRLAARADEEADMLDDSGYDVAPHISKNQVVYDFRSVE
jgi:hypothetical protein